MPASWLSLPSLDTAAPPPSRPDGSGRSVTLVSVLALSHGARRAHSQGLHQLSVVSVRVINQNFFSARQRGQIAADSTDLSWTLDGRVGCDL